MRLMTHAGTGGVGIGTTHGTVEGTAKSRVQRKGDGRLFEQYFSVCNAIPGGRGHQTGTGGRDEMMMR